MWRQAQVWLVPPKSFRLPLTTFRPLSRLSSSMGTAGNQTVDTTQRLSRLRELLKQNNVQAFVVPSEDQRKTPIERFLKRRLTKDAQIPASI